MRAAWAYYLKDFPDKGQMPRLKRDIEALGLKRIFQTITNWPLTDSAWPQFIREVNGAGCEVHAYVSVLYKDFSTYAPYQKWAQSIVDYNKANPTARIAGLCLDVEGWPQPYSEATQWATLLFHAVKQVLGPDLKLSAYDALLPERHSLGDIEYFTFETWKAYCAELDMVILQTFGPTVADVIAKELDAAPYGNLVAKTGKGRAAWLEVWGKPFYISIETDPKYGSECLGYDNSIVVLGQHLGSLGFQYRAKYPNYFQDICIESLCLTGARVAATNPMDGLIANYIGGPIAPEPVTGPVEEVTTVGDSYIWGEVMTPTGGLLTGVPVLLTRGRTVIASESGSTGIYDFNKKRLEGLTGEWELSAEWPGYKKWESAVRLPASLRHNIRFEMDGEPVPVSETSEEPDPVTLASLKTDIASLEDNYDAAARRLDALEKSVPAVDLSAYATKADLDAMMSAADDDFPTKAELEAAVKRIEALEKFMESTGKQVLQLLEWQEKMAEANK